MSTPSTHRRSLTATLTATLTMLAAVAAPAALRAQAAPAPAADGAAEAPRPLAACFVPGSGTVYRIGEAGTPAQCAAGHTAFRWSDGARASTESAAGAKAPGGDASAAASGAAGGDLAGSYPNPTVARLQGRALSTTAPTAGQLLGWNGSAWAPTSPAAGGGALALPYAASGHAPSAATFSVSNGAGGGIGGTFYGAAAGVMGTSATGAAVHGNAAGVGAAGVRAQNAEAAGVALEIVTGGMRVTGAGKDTKTTAFWTEMYCNAKYIDSPHANGRPNAIILVTPRKAPQAKMPTAYVEYDAAVGKWMLKTNNTWDGATCYTPMPVNVLIITP